MINLANTFIAQVFVMMLAIATASIEAATFNISLIQNNAPSPTLFSCEISIENGNISISGNGYSKPLQEMIWERDYSESQTFKDHLISIKDDKMAADFLMIAKHFELCHEGMDMRCVSGGVVTKIVSAGDPDGPVKRASYIALDQSKRRPRLMEDICRVVQMMVVSDVLKEEETGKRSLEALRIKIGKLASDVGAYTKAFSLLEDAHQKGMPADWTKISDLIQFRPNQPPLEKRSQLVRTAHDVLTASCSKGGLQYIFGKRFSDKNALILKIGEVRRCRGSFSYSKDADWGFDDVGTSLGLAYPPHDPALRVGILDLGVERLLLHFLLQGTSDASTAFERFSLVMTGRDLSVVERWSFEKEPIPEGTKGRLNYLSAKSGLLGHLLDGKIPDSVVFLDINAIVIEDDNWKAARLDYRLGDEKQVLPLFITDEAWLPNRPWTERAYRDIGNVIENRDFFRTPAAVGEHNAEQDLPPNEP